MFSDPELTIPVVRAQISASFVELSIGVSTDAKLVDFRPAPVLKSRFGFRQAALGSSATLCPAPATSDVFTESSRIVSEPTLFHATAATLANPELALSVVPAFSTAHSIQFCITTSTNESECCLGPTQFPEAGTTFIFDVSSSTDFLLFPTSTPIRAG